MITKDIKMSEIFKLRMNSKDRSNYGQVFDFYKHKKVSLQQSDSYPIVANENSRFHKVFAQAIQDRVLFRLMVKLSRTWRNRDGFPFEDTQWIKVNSFWRPSVCTDCVSHSVCHTGSLSLFVQSSLFEVFVKVFVFFRLSLSPRFAASVKSLMCRFIINNHNDVMICDRWHRSWESYDVVDRTNDEAINQSILMRLNAFHCCRKRGDLFTKRKKKINLTCLSSSNENVYCVFTVFPLGKQWKQRFSCLHPNFLHHPNFSLSFSLTESLD